MAEVACREIAYLHLTDAEGADLAQIFFEHQPVRHDFARVDRLELALQFSRVACHRLAVAASGEYLLDAHRPAFEQPATGSARIVVIESGIAGQHRVADLRPEGGIPAGQGGSVGLDQRMADHLGRDKGMGYDTTEQVVGPADAERGRLARWSR